MIGINLNLKFISRNKKKNCQTLHKKETHKTTKTKKNVSFFQSIQQTTTIFYHCLSHRFFVVDWFENGHPIVDFTKRWQRQ